MADAAQTRRTFAGSGRGAHAPDGCAVELYRVLPYMGELEPLAGVLPAGTDVLELGCGTGRLTRELLKAGARVTCVDNSEEMLAHVPEGARKVLSDIQALALPACFDVVLLASCLVNHPDGRVQDALLRSASVHMRAGSQLLIQRHDPDWLRSVQAGFTSSAGDVVIRVDSVHRTASEVSIALDYTVQNETWRHEFTAVPLDEPQIAALLARHGLQVSAWLGPRRSWAMARKRC